MGQISRQSDAIHSVIAAVKETKLVAGSSFAKDIMTVSFLLFDIF